MQGKYLHLIVHVFTYVFVTPSFLQSQFTEKGFKKTENSEQNVVLLLFLFMLKSDASFWEIVFSSMPMWSWRSISLFLDLKVWPWNTVNITENAMTDGKGDW